MRSLITPLNETYNKTVPSIVAEAATMSFFTIAAITGNLLVLLSIYRKKSLQSIRNVFVANLAVADLLFGIIGMSLTTVSSVTIRWVFGVEMCQVQGFSNSFFCIVSLLTLSAVSIDRYYVILSPLHYHRKMSPRTVTCMVVYIWLHAFVFAALPFTGWSTYRYYYEESLCTVDWGLSLSYTLTTIIAAFFLPLAIMAYCYYHILRVARAQSRIIAAEMASMKLPETPSDDNNHNGHQTDQSNSNGSNNTPNSPVDIKDRNRISNAFRKYRREEKATITLMTVMGTFIICWSPHFLGIICLTLPYCPFPKLFFTVTTWLALMNSACNPVIYGFLNQKFRNSFYELLGFNKCCKSNKLVINHDEQAIGMTYRHSNAE